MGLGSFLAKKSGKQLMKQELKNLKIDEETINELPLDEIMEEIAFVAERITKMTGELFVNQFTESIPIYAAHIYSYICRRETGFSKSSSSDFLTDPLSTSSDRDVFGRINKILVKHGVNKVGRITRS